MWRTVTRTHHDIQSHVTRMAQIWKRPTSISCGGPSGLCDTAGTVVWQCGYTWWKEGLQPAQHVVSLKLLGQVSGGSQGRSLLVKVKSNQNKTVFCLAQVYVSWNFFLSKRSGDTKFRFVVSVGPPWGRVEMRSEGSTRVDGSYELLLVPDGCSLCRSTLWLPCVSSVYVSKLTFHFIDRTSFIYIQRVLT